ncbi:MAG: hypothetical protein A2Y12_15345 [Planctomycetes bacterium GWF2_42_9]|nr:MAG: hypothetical protein A2Y12_15345 [Planctomycetes bacterium GWF2_42_9]
MANNEEQRAAKFDIANLLGWFECELAKESNIGSPIDARRELIRGCYDKRRNRKRNKNQG